MSRLKTSAKSWVPGLTGNPWTKSDLKSIVADALRVLSEIGVACDQPAAIQRLREWGGTRLVNGRVRFARKKVREHLEKKRAAAPPTAEAPPPAFRLLGCTSCLNYCDPATQEIRPATSGEVAQMVRLWDARNNSGSLPLVPGDLDKRLVTGACERIALKNSRRIGGSGALSINDPEEVRYLADMNQAAGRRYLLTLNVGISPLRLNTEGLNLAVALLDDPRVKVSLGGFLPMTGATCPFDVRTAFVQAVAEDIAMNIVCAAFGFNVSFSVRVEPFDFQYACIVYGSPEWCLLRAGVMQMNEFLNGFRDCYGKIRSFAKRPDGQAGAERMFSVLWQALLGVHQYGGTGELSTAEVFSPQQAVLDMEIAAFVERLVKGIDLESTVEDPLALIRDGIEENGFLSLPDTAERFRDFYLFPQLFRHWSLEGWRGQGSRHVLEMAWERAQQEIASCEFHLTDDQEKAIDAIYGKLCGYLQTKTP